MCHLPPIIRQNFLLINEDKSVSIAYSQRYPFVFNYTHLFTHNFGKSFLDFHLIIQDHFNTLKRDFGFRLSCMFFLEKNVPRDFRKCSESFQKLFREIFGKSSDVSPSISWSGCGALYRQKKGEKLL